MVERGGEGIVADAPVELDDERLCSLGSVQLGRMAMPIDLRRPWKLPTAVAVAPDEDFGGSVDAVSRQQEVEIDERSVFWVGVEAIGYRRTFDEHRRDPAGRCDHGANPSEL